MADQLKFELITRDFNRMLEDLAGIDTRVEFRDIVRSEATAVILTALRRTRAAKVSDLRAASESRTYTTFNGKRYALANKFPDPVWNAIVAHRKKSLLTKLGSRGLAKQSWLHAANLLGANPNTPAYVRRANYKSRQYPQDAVTTETGQGPAFTLTVFNNSPIVQSAGGRRALIDGMIRRTRYYQRALARKFYLTAETRAKAYPGIFVTPGNTLT